MKQSDLEFLQKLENVETNKYKRILQDLLEQKELLLKKQHEMNNTFSNSKPDIQEAKYLRFVALENNRITQKIQELDNKIIDTQEQIRECVKQEKKYDILTQEIIEHKKQQKEKYQEAQEQEFTLSQYIRRL